MNPMHPDRSYFILCHQNLTNVCLLRAPMARVYFILFSPLDPSILLWWVAIILRNPESGHLILCIQSNLCPYLQVTMA